MFCYDYNDYTWRPGDKINLEGSRKVPSKEYLYKPEIINNSFIGQMVYVDNEKCNYILTGKQTSNANTDYWTSTWERITEPAYQNTDTKDMINDINILDNLELNKDNSEMIKRYENAIEEVNNSFVISEQTKNLVISLLNTELRILKGELTKDKNPWGSDYLQKIIY